MLRASVAITLLSVLGLVSAAKAHAQSTLPIEEFDVASIRPNNDAQGSSLVQAVPGSLTMSRISLQRLLVIAYGLKDYQLIGEPSWGVSKRYDLIAKATADSSVEKMEGAMLQAVLEDRFKLRFHRETRVLPLYELVLAKGGLQATPFGTRELHALCEGLTTCHCTVAWGAPSRTIAGFTEPDLD